MATLSGIARLLQAPQATFDCRPIIPDIPAVREVTPLAEQLAELIKPQLQQETRGRKPKWSWEAASLAVVGSIYRGDEREPETLAALEAILGDWFIQNCSGEIPAASLIREHANRIRLEIKKG
jgi:hypothetical protein